MVGLKLFALWLLVRVHGSPGRRATVPVAEPSRDVSAPAFDAYFGAFLSVNGLLGNGASEADIATVTTPAAVVAAKNAVKNGENQQA